MTFHFPLKIQYRQGFHVVLAAASYQLTDEHHSARDNITGMSDRGGGFAQAGDMWPHKVSCGKTFSSNGADFCSFSSVQHWTKRYTGEPDTLRNDDVFEGILLAARLLPAPTCLTSDNGGYVN